MVARVARAPDHGVWRGWRGCRIHGVWRRWRRRRIHGVWRGWRECRINDIRRFIVCGHQCFGDGIDSRAQHLRHIDLDLLRPAARCGGTRQFAFAELGCGESAVARRLVAGNLVVDAAHHAADFAEEAHFVSTIQAAVSMPSSPSFR